VAVPFAVWADTVTVAPAAGRRLTVKVMLAEPALPSVSATSLMVMDDVPSSSTMVPVPWLSAMVALVGELRLTTKVSFTSSSVSPITGTLKFWVVTPALNVSVDGPVAVKSVPEVAVPAAVTADTVIACPLAPERVTAKVRLEEPALPSANETSLIEMVGAASLSVMVPVPVAVPRVALVGELKVTVKVSLASSTVSPTMGTTKVSEVSPGTKVMVEGPVVV
jgi:uncharacterized membrane protein